VSPYIDKRTKYATIKRGAILYAPVPVGARLRGGEAVLEARVFQRYLNVAEDGGGVPPWWHFYPYP